jgi:hypothetical protein
MVSGCDIKFLQTATHPLIHSSLAETAAPSRRCNPRAAEQKRRLPAAAATHAQRRQKRRLPAAAATHAQRRQKRRLPAACNPRAAAAETAAPSRRCNPRAAEQKRRLPAACNPRVAERRLGAAECRQPVGAKHLSPLPVLGSACWRYQNRVQKHTLHPWSVRGNSLSLPGRATNFTDRQNRR